MKISVIALLLFTSLVSFGSDCDGILIYEQLHRLIDVKDFYNCSIEITRSDRQFLDSNGEFAETSSLLVYGKDNFRCKKLGVCPKAGFEITIDKKCMETNKNHTGTIFRYSSGYNIDQRKIRNHMEIRMNAKLTPTYMAFGQTNVNDGKRINYIRCQPNVLGGNK